MITSNMHANGLKWKEKLWKISELCLNAAPLRGWLPIRESSFRLLLTKIYFTYQNTTEKC